MKAAQFASLEVRVASDPVAKDVSFGGATRSRVAFQAEHDDSTAQRAHLTRIEVEAWDATGDQVLRTVRKGDLPILLGQFRDRSADSGATTPRWVFVCTGLHVRESVIVTEQRTNRRTLATRSTKTRIEVPEPAPMDS